MHKMDNGNKDNPPELGPEVVKVAVIGEPGCGKTSFIRAFYNNHFPGEIYSHNGSRVYPCEFDFNDELRAAAIVEIPSDPRFIRPQRVLHYCDTHIYVFMYAFDNPSTFQMLIDRWIPDALDIINLIRKPVVFLGNKKDLRNDPQVLERIANENQTPVTDEQVVALFGQFMSSSYSLGCCSHDVENVEEVFRRIFQIATPTL